MFEMARAAVTDWMHRQVQPKPIEHQTTYHSDPVYLALIHGPRQETRQLEDRVGTCFV